MPTRPMRPGAYEAMLEDRLAELRNHPRHGHTPVARDSRVRPKNVALLTALLTVLTVVVALAVHENTALELDGNTVNDVVAGDDWNDLDDGIGDPNNDDSALISAFQHDEAEPDETHHAPSNKDDNAIDGPGTNEDWGCVEKMNVNNKDDIRHGYAAAYDVSGDTYLFFGADRDTNNGASNIAAWFFQNPVACDPDVNDGNFTGHKTDGDLFIVSEFTNGGRVSLVNIYLWTDPNAIPEDGDECLGDGVDCSTAHSGQDHPFATGIDCQIADPHADPGSPNVCATVNGDGDGDNDDDDIIDVPWEDGSPGDDDPEGAEFFEGGLNLDALFPEGLDCFSQVMLETRSSHEFNANLFDIAFLNFDTCGSIKVIKQTDPDGSTADFDFDLDPDPNAEGTQTLSDGEDFTWDGLNDGTYDLTESDLPAGWSLTDISCNDDNTEVEDLGNETVQLFLDPLEDITCTFTNTQAGNIIVQKETDPDGSLQTFEFDTDYGANFFLADGASNDSGFLDAGTYSVAEINLPAGWTLDSATCDDGSDPSAINLDAGETVTCTFNNSQAGKIIVQKVTDPDPDPSDTSFDFTADYDADGFSLKNGESNDSGNLDAGTYAVSETVPTGWDLTSATCDDGSDPSAIDLDAGETVTCTFTNQADSNIIVEKETDPDGSLQTFEFDTDYGSNFSLADGQSNDSGDLDPGTYAVAEINIPSDWDLTSATCDDGSDPSAIDLAAGETVTCTFTNTQDGTVEVVKTVSGGPPNGMTFDFELRTGASATEEGTTIASTTTDATTGEADFGGQTFDPGTYQFCEVNMLPGWHSTLSDDPGAFVPNSDDPNVDNSVVCVEFTLGAGQTVTFTIDNTPPPGGDARTIGFWKNWTSCDGHGNQDPVLDDTLALFPIASGESTHGVFVGDVYVDTCEEAVDLLNKSVIGGKKVANDAAYALAAQLLAAQLNYQAGAIQCADATDAIDDGQALLDAIGFDGTGSYLGPKVKGAAAVQRAEALALAETLDEYNNNLLC